MDVRAVHMDRWITLEVLYTQIFSCALGSLVTLCIQFCAAQVHPVRRGGCAAPGMTRICQELEFRDPFDDGSLSRSQMRASPFGDGRCIWTYWQKCTVRLVAMLT